MESSRITSKYPRPNLTLMHSVALVGLGLMLSACGIPETDYNKVVAENAELRLRIDELENGQSRLEATFDQATKDDNFSLAKTTLAQLVSTHPQSEYSKNESALLADINQRETEKMAEEERLREEQERLANLNNTGVWQVTHYVDDFGEPTDQGYIRNLRLIRGVFSNTATSNSKLDVRFLIEEGEVNIMLFEYAGNNPVKAYSTETYTALLQDADGSRERLQAKNYSDRLIFGPSHSAKIINALKKGGALKFRIYESDQPVNEYGFDVANADYFENAYRLLTEKD